MNFEFAEQINPYLERMDMQSAILLAEGELRTLPVTEFHAVIGLSLVSQVGELASWIDQFYNLVSARMKVGSLYVEMNEFDINTDHWYIDCFAYQVDGGSDANDIDWLSDYEASSQGETDMVFLIEGYESLQRAFGNFNEASSGDDGQDARDWCEQIVIARFMELIRAAHVSGKENGRPWAQVPVYFTEHAYDFIARSEV